MKQYPSLAHDTGTHIVEYTLQCAEFTGHVQLVPVEKKQRFCSARCCHYYHNRIGNDHIQHAVKPPENRILRTFRCRQCGRVVYVTEKEDKRQRFCSVACSRNYHRHERRRDSGRASGGRAY